jgi:flagellar biosynthetic protein FliQ
MLLGLLISAPVLGTALVSGLIISILQAATQVNEQTLSFVPKIVLTMVVFAVAFPWMMTSLVEFSARLLERVAAGGSP